jgi:SPP1 gp7 family putative phage head morphogenesis protein
MSTLRRRRKPRRPKLPNQAERLYLGAARRYAEAFRTAVLDEIHAWQPDLAAGVHQDSVSVTNRRKDAITAGPFRGLQQARLKITRTREALPLTQVGAEITRHARQDAERVIGLKNTDLFLGGQVAAWRTKNVDLITAMSEEGLAKIQDLLDAYDGLRVEDTVAALEATFGMVRARAELIARDQTLKLNADMAQQAQTGAGVTHYIWSTSQDSSVREDVKGRGDPDHAHLEGLTFSWDEPPVTCERTGDRNHPGQDYQCRCVAVPVLEEYDTPMTSDED